MKVESDRLLKFILEAQNDEVEHFKLYYKDYKPNLEKINRLFIDSQDPVDFIKFLEDTSYSLKIASKISLLPAPKQNNKTTINLQLFLSEDFIKILNFSELLENGPYLDALKSLTIKNPVVASDPKSSPSGKVDATFLIEAFIK